MNPSRLSSTLRAWVATPPPTLAIEIAPHRVSAVAVAWRGTRVSVTRQASEPLPAGAVVPALTAANIPDRAVVVDATKRVLARLGVRTRRTALVMPDPSAKVSIVRFETVPAKAADLEQLIRWQVRKAAPFRIEDAQVSFSPGTPVGESGREFAVVVARRDVVEEYEAVCTAAGLQAGLVDLASFDLVNVATAAAPARGASRPLGAWLLVHLAPGYATLAVVRDGHLTFHRNLQVERDDDLTDMVHQTAMYYEDRLSGPGFGRVVLAGTGAADAPGTERGDRLRQHLEERLRARVVDLDPRPAAALGARVGASADVLDELAAPLGALLREGRG